MVAVTPHLGKPLETLPQDRLAAFTEHLDRCIAQEMEAPAAAGPVAAEERENEAPEATVFAACCATCGGACCTLGAGSHAFLTSGDMRRSRLTLGVSADVAKGVAAATLRAAYLSRLPEMCVRDSCLYHGPTGCTLPRSMRSDICNDFHCFGIKQLAAALDRMGDARDAWPVAVVAENDGIVGAVGRYLPGQGWARVDPQSRSPEDS